MEAIEIQPMALERMKIQVEGISRLVVHKMSEKNRKRMRDLHQGKKEKVKGKRDPQQEYEDARYILTDGRDGVNVMAFKKSIVGAAHRDMGIARTTMKQSIYVIPDGVDHQDATELIALTTPGPKFDEGVVRLKDGSTDLRYRPRFDEWKAILHIEYDSDWLRLDSLVNLINRAGWRIGLCEQRPEKSGGDWGRYKVSPDQPKMVKETS